MVTTTILLQACLNGYRAKEEHDRIPLAPDDLATDALASARAGARALHVHPRAADGSESVTPEDVGAAVGAIRRMCPDLPIGVTTGAWIEPDPARRLDAIRAWDTLPDFASVNFFEAGAAELALLLLDLGVEVEAGVTAIEDVHALAQSGIAGDCLRVLVEITEEAPSAAVDAAAALSAELGRLRIGTPQLHHGSELATWAVLDAAIRGGHHIRVGLEDTLVLPDGSRAVDNAQLVAAAATTIAEVLQSDRF